MKRKILMLICLILSTSACAGNKGKNIEIRELTPEAKKLLGLDEKGLENTALIAITSKGPILYNVEKGKRPVPTDGQGKDSPLGRTLIGNFSIYRFKNSPECNYFDFNGFRYWYPRPPCPTN